MIQLNEEQHKNAIVYKQLYIDGPCTLLSEYSEVEEDFEYITQIYQCNNSNKKYKVEGCLTLGKYGYYYDKDNQIGSAYYINEI
jgi:hypothetical protein